MSSILGEDFGEAAMSILRAAATLSLENENGGGMIEIQKNLIARALGMPT